MPKVTRLFLRRTRAAVIAIGVVAAATAIAVAGAAPSEAATTITINGGSTGRTFDGVGAVSGGGGNTRLLVDYPEPQRGQILDYLFKPGYGAALQILKVEMGGDTNSTSGAEPSHAHSRGDLDCNRGYEWWLMEQAKTRNPGIKLVGLPWGAPGWIGNGTFFSNELTGYYLSWLGCAKQLARGINRVYLDGKMTVYLHWDLIAAVTPNIPWPTVGLILANQPWSGYYSVGKDTWALAHTTQFTAPGWKYLDSSSGYLRGNRNNGSYVSLKSTNNTDYSTVIETMDATSA